MARNMVLTYLRFRILEISHWSFDKTKVNWLRAPEVYSLCWNLLSVMLFGHWLIHHSATIFCFYSHRKGKSTYLLGAGQLLKLNPLGSYRCWIFIGNFQNGWYSKAMVLSSYFNTKPGWHLGWFKIQTAFFVFWAPHFDPLVNFGPLNSDEFWGTQDFWWFFDIWGSQNSLILRDPHF